MQRAWRLFRTTMSRRLRASGVKWNAGARCEIGDSKIGRHGGGERLPANVTVVGVPARIVRRNGLRVDEPL